MLRLALLLLLIALVLGFLGFGGVVVGGLVDIAVILFWVFIALFIVSLLAGGIRGRGI